MMKASGRSASASKGDAEEGKPIELGEEHGQALQDLAQKVERFVGGQGDIEGARFEEWALVIPHVIANLLCSELSDDGLDEEMPSDEEEEEGTAQPGLSMAEQDERMRSLVPALPVDEWGQKAAVDPATSAAKKETRSAPSRTSKPVQTDEDLPKMRRPIFAKQSFDGVASDSDEDTEDEDLPAPGTLGRKIAEMKWSEGAPQIEEIDDEPNRKVRLGLGDDIDEQMRQRVWGVEDERLEDGVMEIDPDMGEEEEEFLRFSREALGISGDMWEKILSNRRERGGTSYHWKGSNYPADRDVAFVPKPKPVKESENNDGLSPPAQNTNPPRKSSGTAAAPSNTALPAAPPNSGQVNMDLDSFEKVMAAMDTELAKANSKTTRAPPPPLKKPNKTPSSKRLSKLPTEADLDDMDEDDLAAMDRELRAALRGAGVEDDDDDMGELDVDEAEELEGEEKREYKMMRDFLESYRSQAGGSGVVGNLFGRLGKGE